MRFDAKLLSGAMALLAAAPASAQAQEWRVTGLSGTGGKTTVSYVDRLSVATTGPDRREFTGVGVYENPVPAGNATFNVIEQRYAINCTTNTATPLNAKLLLNERLIGQTSTGLKQLTPPPDSVLGKAAAAACSGDFAKLPRANGATPLADATDRYLNRKAMRASLGSSGWLRTALQGTAGKRLAIFVDPEAIASGPGGTRTVPVMLVSEASAVNRLHYQARIHCAARSILYLIETGFRRDGSSAGEIVPEELRVPAPGSLLASLIAPVCTGDRTALRYLPGTAAQAVPLAFAP